MVGADADQRISSWRRLLAAIACIAVGLAACGGGLLWSLDEMRDANRRASYAEQRVKSQGTTINSNKERIAQLEADIRANGREPPSPDISAPAPTPDVVVVPQPSPSTSTTTTPTSPSTTTPAPSTTTTTTTAAPPSPPTTRPCTASVAGECLIP